MLHHGGHAGAHLQKNFNEFLLLCAPTWPSWPLLLETFRFQDEDDYEDEIFQY